MPPPRIPSDKSRRWPRKGPRQRRLGAVPIHAPTDDRNLRWRRRIFEGAEHDEDQASVLTLSPSPGWAGTCYVADLPKLLCINGFPTRVELTFGTAMLVRLPSLATVDLNRPRRRRAGTLPADELETRKIEADGARLQEILKWLTPARTRHQRDFYA